MTLQRLTPPLVVLTLLAGTLVAMDVARVVDADNAAIAGLLGGVLTVGIGLLLVTLARRQRWADELVEERTSALAESERSFRLLADNSTDWITRHAPDGTWTYVSPACRVLLGYEPSELTGRSPYEFVHFRDRTRLRWADDTLLAQPGVQTVSYRFRAKDGRWVWFETKSHGVADPETDGLVEVQCVTRDISERVSVEQELRRQSRFLETVLDSVGAGIVACDADGGITLVNRATREIHGLDREQALPADWIERETLYDAEGGMLRREHSPLVRALSGESVDDQELVTTRPDGSARGLLANARPILDEEGELVGAVVAMQDITERLQAEDYVRESERRFRALAENSPVGVYETDPVGGRRFVNERWVEIAGISAAEAIGDGWERALHPDDRQAVLAEWKLVSRLGREFNAEFRFLHPDGKVVWAWSKAHKLTGELGETTGYIGTCIDITQRKADDELRKQWEQTFTHTRRGISVTDSATGLLQSVNPAFAAMHGGEVDDFVGKPLTSVVTPEAAGRIPTPSPEDDRDGFTAYESEHVRLDGTTLPVATEIVAARGVEGEQPYLIAYYTDLTEQRRLEAARKHDETRLKHLADHDALTGLLNRRRFEEELERELAGAARYGTGGALLALDVDDFKHVNDSMGHSVGDELITRVGDLLRGRLRKSDVIARLGGDEFAVILPQVNEQQARTVAEGLLEAVRADGGMRLGEHGRQVTFSIGIAMFDSVEAPTAGKILVEADIAMYDAKEAGRARAMLYDGARHRRESMHAPLAWADRIRDALDTDGLVLHAQPIVGPKPGATPRYELQVQMKGEDGELISPGTFRYVAERFELVQRIDRWVVRGAIALLAEEQRAGRDVRFDVKLSAKSVVDPDLPDLIERELTEAEVDPAGLCFAATETTAAAVNADQAKLFAKRMAGLGCLVPTSSAPASPPSAASSSSTSTS